MEVKINPFSAGTAFMLMQTGWIQASRNYVFFLCVAPRSIISHKKNKQNFKVLKSRRQNNLFLENYPAFKGLRPNDFRLQAGTYHVTRPTS